MKDKNLDKSFLGHPKPLASLSLTELWERFSFYGIRPLLVLFMAASITSGGLGIAREDASAIVGIFGAFVYLATLPGAWLADNLLGQKRAVFYGAIIIALGHLSIALSYFESKLFFFGLILIVIGTGLFKTCASVMVGTLYKENDSRRDSGFTIFYMGINIGAFFAPLLCGAMLEKFGWHFGFGVGGIGMLIALGIFYFKTIPEFDNFQKTIGFDFAYDKAVKNSKNALLILGIFIFIIILAIFLLFSGFIKIDPVALSKQMILIILVFSAAYFFYLFFFAGLNKKDKNSLIIFVILFFAAACFWGVFEQQPTTYNLFAQDFTNRLFFGFEIPTPWFQSLNPLFIIILAPIASIIWISLAKQGFELHSISKFTIGLILAGVGFSVMLIAAKLVLASGGAKVSMSWISISILLLTLGELCLSPVGLSIMTKIAPNLIKNQVMGLWFVATALGNVVAGLIGGEIAMDKIEQIPELFTRCIIALFVVALILFLLKNFITKITQKS